MVKRKLKKEEIRKDPFREFLAKAFSEIETSLEVYWKYYLLGFGLVVLTVAGIYFYMEDRQLKNEKNELFVNEILEIADAPVMAKDNPERENYVKNGVKTYLTDDEKSSELNKKINELIANGPTKSQKNTVMMAKASDLARKGSYEESLKILDEIAKDDRFKVSALLLKAKIYEMQNDFAKAENVYKEISSVNTLDLPKPLGIEMLGEFYQRNNKKEEALKAYNDALKILQDEKAKIRENNKKPPATFVLGNEANQDMLESKLKEKIGGLNS
jgi:tetratricopeptide (TPR) repeat protein